MPPLFIGLFNVLKSMFFDCWGHTFFWIFIIGSAIVLFFIGTRKKNAGVLQQILRVALLSIVIVVIWYVIFIIFYNNGFFCG